MTQKIDSQNLDVIVIGAGPAGGSATRELAKRGKKVLLIERSQEIGEPNYSTAGTPKETIAEFDLPEKVISASWNKILWASPRVKAAWEYPKTMGYVFDFAALKKFLAEDAAKYGAEIMVGTSVEEFVVKNDSITGVRYHGVLGNGTTNAKIIIDATGHHELANRKLNLNPYSIKYLANAMEYQMTGLAKELHDTIAFYVGTGYATQGYAWVFPMRNNEAAKVGVCTYRYAGSKSLEKMQEEFMNNLGCFENMEPTEIHAGAAIADGGVKNHVYKNLILVGDSAHQINPLAGEGVRHSLAAGRMAAEVITDAFKNPVLNLTDLKKTYEHEWRATFSRKWRFSFAVGNFATQASDEQIDGLLEVLRDMEVNDFYDFFFHYNHAVIFKYPELLLFLAKNIKDVAGIIKETQI